MTITPELVNALCEATTHGVLLLPHVGADGDALGASLGLKALLARIGVFADVVAEEAVPVSLRFLPGWETIIVDDGSPRGPYDLVLMLDCHTPNRVGQRARFLCDSVVGAIDHHQHEALPSAHFVVDTHASSTSELVYDLALKLISSSSPLPFDRSLASVLLAGMVSDTGRFSYPNTTPHTLEVASQLLTYGPDLGALAYELFERKTLSALRMKGYVFARAQTYRNGTILISTVSQQLIESCQSSDYDLNTIPSELRTVSGVAVAFLVRETKTPGDIRVNIRSDGRLDAAALAKRFGGGGHQRAAGATLTQTTLDAVVTTLVREATAWLDGAYEA